jgi:hypothetical protein
MTPAKATRLRNAFARSLTHVSANDAVTLFSQAMLKHFDTPATIHALRRIATAIDFSDFAVRTAVDNALRPVRALLPAPPSLLGRVALPNPIPDRRTAQGRKFRLVNLRAGLALLVLLAGACGDNELPCDGLPATEYLTEPTECEGTANTPGYCVDEGQGTVCRPSCFSRSNRAACEHGEWYRSITTDSGHVCYCSRPLDPGSPA